MPCFVVFALLVGCRSTPIPGIDPGPLTPPIGIKVNVGSYAGTPLGGAVANLGPEALDTDPRQAVPLEVDFLYLESPLPETAESLAPLALTVDLALATDRRDEVLATARLFHGARIGTGPFAMAMWDALVTGERGRSCSALSSKRVLLDGATATFRLGLLEEVIDSDNFLREFPDREPFAKAITLRVALAGESIDVLIGIASAAPRLDEGALVSPAEAQFRPGGPAPLEEWVRPRISWTEPFRTILLLLPTPFEAGEARTLAIRIAVGAPLGETDEDLAELTQEVARVVADVQKVAFELASAALVFGQSPTSTERTVRAALDGLRYASDLRAVFAYLTGVLEPEMALDFVLIADQANLAALAEIVATDRTVGPGQLGKAAFDARWSVERGCWALLANNELSGGTNTPAELSLLLRHGGEVGRFPALIEEALALSSSCEAFLERLVQENLVFLKDASPAARVRAYDWLVARALAPIDFDPLASRAARRASLDSWQASLEQAMEDSQ